MRNAHRFIIYTLFIFAIVGCNSTHKKQIHKEKIKKVSKELNSETYFKIIGTEPFWNIEIAENKIVFMTLEGTKIEFPYNIPSINKNDETRVYKTVNGNGSIVIELKKGDCTDGMSDLNYNFYAEITLVQMKKKQNFKGCGFFVADKTLSGKWNLKKIESLKLSNSENIPFLDFDIENNHISGNAGCNGLSASFVLKSNEISFNQILLTRMFCEDLTLENNFVSLLSEINSFKIEEKNLYLYKGDQLKMVFKKKDKF